MIVQGASDAYTSTASYQPPVLTTIPLNDISSELDLRPNTVSHAASVRPPGSLPRHQHGRQLQQDADETGVNRSSYEDHYYSEINSEPASPSSSSTSSLPVSSAAVGVTTMTSPSHVTETDTPIEEAGGAEASNAVYSGLDTATLSEPRSSPSVYQTLSGTGQVLQVRLKTMRRD